MPEIKQGGKYDIMAEPVKKRREEQQKQLKLNEKRLNILHDHLRELQRHDVKCKIVDEKAIMGSHNNEPFIVYTRCRVEENGENYMFVVVTRFKGKDTILRKPVDVITGE